MGAKEVAKSLWNNPFVWKLAKSWGMFVGVVIVARELAAADAANVAEIMLDSLDTSSMV